MATILLERVKGVDIEFQYVGKDSVDFYLKKHFQNNLPFKIKNGSEILYIPVSQVVSITVK